MIRYLMLLFCTAISTSTQAQTGNVGIGTSTPNARLEITATNPSAPSQQDGILIPRTNVFPATNPGAAEHGMALFLTAPVGTNVPGFYFWDFYGNSWKPIGSGLFWGLAGNSGTVSGNNFIGTTDNTDVVFKRNNMYAGSLGISNTSWGINSLQPSSTGTNNTAIGRQASYSNITGYNNTAIGSDAHYSNQAGYNNVAVGSDALLIARGNNNTALGYQAGLMNFNGNNNVFIGHAAGADELGSNKLYIHNSGANSSNALIYGEFDNKILRTNGRMEIFSTSTVDEGLKVIKSYPSGTLQHRIAVFGQNVIDEQYGIGVQGRGGSVGVDGYGSGAAFGTYTGVRGMANNTNSGTNIGVFGSATGGMNNYGGYFLGNTYISGNVGIGIAPISKLTLHGGGGDAFTIMAGGDTRIYNTDESASCLFYAQGGTGVNNATFIIASDGKSFAFNGTGGSVSSDARLKQDINPLDKSLEKLMQINGYSYRFKTKASIEKKEIGILAQEVMNVLPEAVFTNEDGTYSVSYNSLVPLLINGIKEQQKVIESQNTKIKDQDQRIKKLEEQMSLFISNQ